MAVVVPDIKDEVASLAETIDEDCECEWALDAISDFGAEGCINEEDDFFF